MIQSFSLQGKRDSNEDQHVGIINISNVDKTINPVNFMGVFDGHGGKLVSKFLRTNLPKYIFKKNGINILIDVIFSHTNKKGYVNNKDAYNYNPEKDCYLG